MTNIKYFTNIITSNESSLDNWSNYLLQPMTRLWELKTGTKQVREFFVHEQTKALFESTEDLLELTTQRIALDILLAIPFTIAGIICKFLATFNPEVAKNYQNLFNSTLLQDSENIDFLLSETKNEVIEEGTNYRITPIKVSLVPEAVLTILSHLSIEDIKNIRLVNKGFLTLTDSNIGRKVAELYCKTHLKGITLDPKLTPSYRAIIFCYQNHLQKFHYRGLEEVFGDVQNIFHLKIYQTTLSAYGINHDVDNLAHTDDFKAYPPVFRLRFKKSNHSSEEAIVIKYSLFVPKEFDGADQDKVWHDCLVLTPPCKSKKNWRVSDLRHFDQLPTFGPSSSRITYGYQEFPASPTEPFLSQLCRQTVTSSTLDDDKVKLRNLILNKTVGFYTQKTLQQTNPYLPSFIYGCYRRSNNSRGRLFLNLPVKLGHVPVKDFEFTVQKLPAVSQLYVDPQGRATKHNPTVTSFEADKGGALEMLTFDAEENMKG